MSGSGSGSLLESLKERAAASLRVPVGALRMQPVGVLGAGDLARQTRERRSRALVLSIQSLPDARTQMRILLEAAGCPVVLVR